MIHKLPHKSAAEREVLLVAKFHALMRAKHLGNLLLLCYVFITSLRSIHSYPPLYILTAHNLFPLFLHQILNPKHNREPLTLPLFAQKYNYNYVKYQSNAMSFLCTCLFLYLWQRTELSHPPALSLFPIAPTLILFLIVSFRIGGIIYYSNKFDQILTYGSGKTTNTRG